MTIDISDNNPRIEYAVAQGVVQTVFAVPFEFFEDSDVSIYVDGTLKVLGTDYNLTGGDGSTGTATFVTATPPAVQQVTGATGGSTVAVVRHVSLERTTDFAAGQEINRASLNEQLDTITAQIADLDNKVDRTIHLSDFEVAPSMLLTDDRKGRVLAFDTTTGDVEAGPLSNDIQTIADNISEILAADDEAAAAAASATAAASSASAASSSASAAASSETAAETAETNAETAQTAAETAESNAATSEANAATSETNAATSATNAATSESNAASSASSAQASKDAALAALDSFDDRYLGAKASDPTLDNDGDALVAGALYYNTSDDVMKVYEGSLWVAAYASLSGALLQANNLSDLASASAARTNLGLATVASTGGYSDLTGLPTLGTAAATASTDYATAAQGALADSALQDITGESIENLSDVASMTPSDGQALVYGSGVWSAADMAGGIAYTRHTANVTMAANEGVIADTSGGAFTVTLPATPAVGDTVVITDGADWATTNLTVGRNGSTIEGDAADMTMDIGGVAVQFTYDGTTWQIYTQLGANSSNVVVEDSSPTFAGLTVDTDLDVTGTVTATSYNGDGSSLTGISSTPAGTVIYYAGNTAPTGYLKANGAAISRSTYADLFSAIGTTFGAGDGSTTFLLPDLRGEFMRGWDDTRGIDSGRSFGSAQGDAIRNITGKLKAGKPFGASGVFTGVGGQPGGGDGNQVSGAEYTFDASTVVPTASENRPRNVALLACIKY